VDLRPPGHPSRTRAPANLAALAGLERARLLARAIARAQIKMLEVAMAQDSKPRPRGSSCCRGAPENQNPSNHLHIHHQGDNTQGDQGLIQDGAEENDKHPHVPAEPKV